MGIEGLKLLNLAKQETGLPIITEVMAPGDVETVAKYADILQVGARNMQNYNLLDEVGAINKPVMVKRGMAAPYEEWLLAAEYVMAAGNTQVMLCERGIRGFEQFTRFYSGRGGYSSHQAPQPPAHNRRPPATAQANGIWLPRLRWLR